jgi:flavin-dependent dehydrogenase
MDMNSHFDVVIFGGGPAGALTACLLRKQCPHLSVCILEKSVFPRHHIGESTLPGWSSVLERAGAIELLDDHTIIKKGGVVFNWGPAEAGDSWTVDFREVQTGRPAPGSWFVNRATFDTALLDHTESLGCVVRQNTTVQKVIQEREDLFSIYTNNEQLLTAATVVDATGQARLLSRLWKIPVHKHESLTNFALYGYWKTTAVMQPEWELRDNERWAIFSSIDDGWVWFIPIDVDVVSVGFVTDQATLKQTPKDKLLERYLQTTSQAAQIGELLQGAEYLGDRPDASQKDRVSAIQDWSYRSTKSCGPGWFLVGDAAMFVDPILSSGMYLAAQGASMVANAITSLQNGVDDQQLLYDSYQQTYQELADSYVRMANVWYQKNTRSDSWHWQARRERLRSGGLSLYERDQDAFTVLALGAIGSPLDAAISKSCDDMWGSEFFVWMTAGRLFSDKQERGQQRIDADQARDTSRRELAQRWRTLLNSKLQLKPISWQQKQRYHTNGYTETWEKIQYLEVLPMTVEWKETPIIFASFKDYPEGILPHLQGEEQTLAILRRMVLNHPLASSERNRRVKGIAEMLLQLQMMGLLENISQARNPPSSKESLFAVLIPSVLQRLDVPCQVLFELDWLGEMCTIRLIHNEKRSWIKVYDKRSLDLRKTWRQTHQSAITWDRTNEPWFLRLVEQLQSTIDRKEQRCTHNHWDDNLLQGGLGIQFKFAQNEKLIANLF